MTKITRRDSLVLLSGALFSGCNSRFFSPTGPSATSENGQIGQDGLIGVDTPEGQIRWSPYLVVQPDAGAVEGYRKVLTEMKARGNVRGVRIPLNSFRDPVVQMVSSLGLEMTGVISNEDLFDPNPQTMIDRYISIFPDMKVLQIGNEVSTLPGTETMTVEQYMDVFKKIYSHVQLKHPSIILMTQSTFGSHGSRSYGGLGSYGSNELKRMVELGLKPDILSPQRVIVGINVYTDDALSDYVSTRNQYLSTGRGGYRIWVMECGHSDPSGHISKVKDFYPRMANSLSAERIYWYVAWGGDAGATDAGYSLIQNPRDPNRMTYSPLGKALAGIQ